jgi:hypothetical protein
MRIVREFLYKKYLYGLDQMHDNRQDQRWASLPLEVTVKSLPLPTNLKIVTVNSFSLPAWKNFETVTSFLLPAPQKIWNG